jgi:Zn-dependent protease
MSGGMEGASAQGQGDWLEREYQATLQRLRNPKRMGQGLLLIGSLVLFVLLRGHSSSVQSLVILVGVLFFHELGHFAGMRLFGYRDVRMFFIPFFGAAVSGRRGGVAAWKEGVVLLLGPLPGILVGFALGLRGATLSPTSHEVAVSLITINTFNLLPLAGLDGARLLQHVLFSRRRWLELGFQGCAGIAAGALAINWKSFALGALAYLMLIILPYRSRLLNAAGRIRAAGLSLPADPAALDGDAARALFLEARKVTGEQRGTRPPALAAAMEQLLDAATTQRPSWGASVLLGLALFVTFVLGAAGLALLVAHHAG